MPDTPRWICCRQRAGPLVKESRAIRPRLSKDDSPFERAEKNKIIRPPRDSSVCRTRVDRLELLLALFGFDGWSYTLTFSDPQRQGAPAGPAVAVAAGLGAAAVAVGAALLVHRRRARRRSMSESISLCESNSSRSFSSVRSRRTAFRAARRKATRTFRRRFSHKIGQIRSARGSGRRSIAKRPAARVIFG